MNRNIPNGARLALITAVVLLLAATAMAEAPGPDYQIGVDDVLAVSVWDNKDLDQDVFVRPDGKISLPLLGEVRAGGLTVAQLQARLTELYSRTVKSVHVTVAVKEIRSRPIFFLGGVGRPGPMQLTQDRTLLQAISVAGGVLPAADLESAFVLRADQKIPVDFVKLIQKGDLHHNLRLQPGDTIVIPIADTVYVQGEVKTPGALKFTKDLTIVKAITQAGGFTPLAAPRAVTLLRGDAAKKQNISVNVHKIITEPEAAADLPLQPNDVIIVVPQADMIYVQGEVKTPGAFKFTNDLTIVKVITQAGGFTPLAAAKRVTLLRGEGAKKQNISVNVQKIMTEPDGTADMPLQPNDIIIVPQRLF